jgi:hypothetical protein
MKSFSGAGTDEKVKVKVFWQLLLNEFIQGLTVTV